jgi:hypothetical protein
MSRWVLPVIAIGVGLATFFEGLAPAAEGAARNTPTPSPTATVTPMPTAGGPAAPSGLRVEPLAMFWNDNSNDEDGFLIDLTVCGSNEFERHLHYQVPANTTSFTFPPEYLAAKNACACGYQDWKVTAFNSRGQASAFSQTGIPMCAPAPTATPFISLPATGSGDGHPGSSGLPVLLAAGILSLGVGIAVFARARRSDRAT